MDLISFAHPGRLADYMTVRQLSEIKRKLPDLSEEKKIRTRSILQHANLKTAEALFDHYNHELPQMSERDLLSRFREAQHHFFSRGDIAGIQLALNAIDPRLIEL